LNDKFDLIIGRNVPLSPGCYEAVPGSPLFYATRIFLPKSFGRFKPVTEDDGWLSIFRGIKKFAEKDAELFLTLLMKPEFLRAQEILKKAGYTVLEKQQNMFPCVNDNACFVTDYKDNYVILGSLGSS